MFCGLVSKMSLFCVIFKHMADIKDDLCSKKNLKNLRTFILGIGKNK